jgi:hypothetical protein
MDEKLASEFVVRELAKHRNRNDIILALCQSDKIDWKTAQQFVEQVELKQGRRIATGQAPLLILLGIAFIIGGLYVTIRYVVATMNGAMIFQWPLPIPYLGNVTRIGGGIAMVTGGMFGILKAVWDMIK